MVVAAMGSLACAGLAQADTWFPAATATLLSDGQVLVAGGCNSFDEALVNVSSSRANLDLAELFNVSTDTWTKAAPMREPDRL
jgi:Kelch motif